MYQIKLGLIMWLLFVGVLSAQKAIVVSDNKTIDKFYDKRSEPSLFSLKKILPCKGRVSYFFRLES